MTLWLVVSWGVLVVISPLDVVRYALNRILFRCNRKYVNVNSVRIIFLCAVNLCLQDGAVEIIETYDQEDAMHLFLKVQTETI